MANTGEEIGVDYKTLMPDLTDIADIQQAYQMYHIGIANWDGITPPAANSIEGHFSSVNGRVDDLEARPVGGGEVNTSEPTAVGPQSLPVPEGYIWVDPDALSPGYPEFPTVLYSPTQPTGLGVGDVGTIWVDENSTADVLNVNDYQIRTEINAIPPANPQSGQFYVDPNTNALYCYDGSVWTEVGGGSGGGGFPAVFLMMGA